MLLMAAYAYFYSSILSTWPFECQADVKRNLDVLEPVCHSFISLCGKDGSVVQTLSYVNYLLDELLNNIFVQ